MKRMHTINSNKAMEDMVELLLKIKKSMSLRIQGKKNPQDVQWKDKLTFFFPIFFPSKRRGAATRQQQPTQ